MPPLHVLLFRIAARNILYAPSHRQDSTYHSLSYTSHGPLAGTRNSSMGHPTERIVYTFVISFCYTKRD